MSKFSCKQTLHPGPYIRSLSEKLEKVCNALGIDQDRLLASEDNMADPHKSEDTRTKGVFVYEVPYKDCRKTYVEEAQRTLKTRLGEHRQAVKRVTPRMELQCMPITPSMQLLGWEQE